MRSLNVQVVLEIPAKEAWRMFMNSEIFSKVNPDVIASAEIIRGNGGPGTLRLVKFGPALKNYASEALEDIENVEIGRSVKFKVIEGEFAEMYNPYIESFTFIPMEGKEKDQCIAELEIEFEPVSPEIPPPEKSREAGISLLKSFEDYYKHHE